MRAVVGATPVLVWHMYVHSIEDGFEYQHPVYAYQRADYQFHNVSMPRISPSFDPFAPREGQGHAGLRREAVCKESDRDSGNVRRVCNSPRSYWEWQASWIHQKHGNLAVVARPAVVALGLLVAAGLGVLAWRRQWLPVLYVIALAGLVCTTSWGPWRSRGIIRAGLLPRWRNIFDAGNWTVQRASHGRSTPSPGIAQGTFGA